MSNQPCRGPIRPMSRIELDANIGERIRELRKAREWGQKQLAQEAATAGLGTIAHTTISKIEEGRSASVWMLAAIAHALDVTIDELVPV